MTRRGGRAALVVVAGALAASLGLAGCVSVPSAGPVVDVDSTGASGSEQASARDASPPEKGATTVEVVDGFLDAMQSWPVDVSVARQYLDRSAASSWNPEAATVTYTDNLPPQDRSNRVTVQLSGAERIDGRGAWQGPLPASKQTLRLDLVLEDGEYRISDPPDALLVPTAWFAQRYRQVSLYFFDPTGQILVPEPVFVPRGQQLVSTLTERLLEGPEPEPRGLTRTYLPPGLSVGLSVTIADDGTAEIALTGGDVPGSQSDVERMLAQLAWTLRQEPLVTGLRITVGGEGLPLPDGGQVYDIEEASRFAPDGYLSDDDLWALNGDGLLVHGGLGSGFEPSAGPWGSRPPGVRSVAVDLRATTVAGVGAGGTSLLTAPAGEVAPRRRATTTVITDGTDLLAPVWDFTGRLWALDRTTSGARVRYVEDGRLRELRVPGVTGTDVRAFLVSRDGTRLVAVVRTDGVDQVRVGRVVADERGRVQSATRTTGILAAGEDPPRIVDVGWSSPTSVAVLSEVVEDEVYEIGSIPVDGAPSTGEPGLATTLSGRVGRLAVSPEPGAVQYAVIDDGVVDLGASTRIALPQPLTSLGYVG